MGMTEQEAIKYIEQHGFISDDVKDMAIKALEEVEKLRKENSALKNRCYVLTHGQLCFFCPIDCSDRKVKFRSEEDAE